MEISGILHGDENPEGRVIASEDAYYYRSNGEVYIRDSYGSWLNVTPILENPIAHVKESLRLDVEEYGGLEPTEKGCMVILHKIRGFLPREELNYLDFEPYIEHDFGGRPYVVVLYKGQNLFGDFSDEELLAGLPSVEAEGHGDEPLDI